MHNRATHFLSSGYPPALPNAIACLKNSFGGSKNAYVWQPKLVKRLSTNCSAAEALQICLNSTVYCQIYVDANQRCNLLISKPQKTTDLGICSLTNSQLPNTPLSNHIYFFNIVAFVLFAASLRTILNKTDGFDDTIQCQLVDRETFINKKVTSAQISYVLCETGLQYRDIVIGEGPETKEGQVVYVHYESAFGRSRSPLESTFKRSLFPVRFVVGSGNSKIIKAIDEGVRGMKKGGARELIVPPSLGYIGSIDEVLIYKLYLVKVKNPNDFSYLEWVLSKWNNLFKSKT